MKCFILPAIVSLSALTSLGYELSASATINPLSTTKKELLELTTVTPETTSNAPSVQNNPEANQVAYQYCYWETYFDGSVYWVCW